MDGIPWGGMIPMRMFSFQRSRAGQVALSLNIVLSIFVVGSLGLMCYEVSRILLAREQLRHCLELTALGGGVAMASTSQSGTLAQTEAKTVALNMLKKNAVLGQPLTTSVVEVTSVSALNPTPGQVQVFFEFDDPITKAPVAAGQDSGVLKVYGAYAYPLFSGGFGSIGVNTYTLVSEATAGMPALDVVIVNGSSGSMDDQTRVTMVRRYWDQDTNDRINYPVPTPGGVPSEGTIASLICVRPSGSNLNGMEPQNLDAAGDDDVARCPKEFSETGAAGRTVPLRGLTLDAPPGDAPPSAGVGLGGMTRGPGDTQHSFAMAPRPRRDLTLQGERADIGAPSFYTASLKAMPSIFEQPAFAHFTSAGDLAPSSENPWGADLSLFTDMVVNLDRNTHFGGYTDPNGFAFPTIDYLVEASRGNLEDGNVSPNAWVSTNLDSQVRVGYKEAYDLAAYKCLEPKITVESSLKNFMNKLVRSSDCHFSFVAFADRAGTNPNDFYKEQKISWAYPAAGKVKVRLPMVSLDPSASNYTTVTDILTPPANRGFGLYVPNGGSNLAAGLTSAYNELTGPGSRTGAVKAIVVMTDKVPTRDLAGNIFADPSANGQAIADAVAVADRCKAKGIPIFVVALDQDGQQTNWLNAQFSEQNGAGLCSHAAHGGQLYIDRWVDPTTTLGTLNKNFNTVARQLLTLVQG